MRKDKRLIGILSLAAATVVVMGASIAVGKQPDNLNPPEIHVTGLPSQSEGENGGTVAVVEGEKVDLTGADASIVDAVKTAEGTYVLTIETTGYNESKPITLQVTYSADAQTVLGYEVVSHGETPGLGANIEGADFKNQFAGVALPVYVPGMDMSAFGENTDEQEAEQETENEQTAEVLFKDGEYAIETEPSSDGSVVRVTMTVENGKIAKMTWDEGKEGAWKSELSEQGKYVMKPIWKTQAESMCAYVVENQSTDGLNLTDAGKTDAVAGVSISVNGFVDLVNEAIAEANGADGTYEKVKDDAVFVSVTIADGKITAVTWDEKQNGEWKSALSEQGKYVMKPIWKTQAESMCAYVVENQSTAGLNLNDSGKTDVVAGVSVSVGTFVEMVDDLLNQAKAVAYEDGVHSVVKDNVHVSVTIENGKITAVTWDEDQNGEWKSELSAAGKYVMKPIWKTQAESMCAYVVENQSTDGLNLTDAGKTDVVAGVSISVNTFVDLVNEAIAEANGADGTYEKVKDDAVFVSVTIADGKITAVTWDEKQNGEWKSVLSEQGKYVMKPIWKTQAESMCAYVVENQSTAGLNVNDNGKTDVVAGVSISVNTFVDLVNEALVQAGGTADMIVQEQAKKEEEVAIDATKIDAISGATVSSKAVARAVNNGYLFLRDYVK